MKLFGSRDEGHYIIVGCGRLGASLATTLSEEGKSVFIIDKDKDSFRKLSPSFAGIIIEGDATESCILHEANIEKATAVIAVTNHDNTNIMVAQISKELFHTKYVVARLYDPEREMVYHEFGIETICPAVLSTKEIDKLLGRQSKGGTQMKRRAYIIDGFKETRFLAQSLIKKGYQVSVINSDLDHCNSLANIDKLSVYHGDGSKPFVLDDSNIFGADIVIALSDRDEDNLVICELCKKKFQVKKTVAVINDPKKIEFFYRMGVDSVLCAITAIASIIEQQTLMDKISMSLPVGAGQIKIVQVSIPFSSPVVGKKLMEINLPKDAIVGCVFRGDKSVVPGGNTQILAGDILVLISTEEHEFAAVQELTGQ